MPRAYVSIAQSADECSSVVLFIFYASLPIGRPSTRSPRRTKRDAIGPVRRRSIKFRSRTTSCYVTCPLTRTISNEKFKKKKNSEKFRGQVASHVDASTAGRLSIRAGRLRPGAPALGVGPSAKPDSGSMRGHVASCVSRGRRGRRGARRNVPLGNSTLPTAPAQGPRHASSQRYVTDARRRQASSQSAPLYAQGPQRRLNMIPAL